MTTAAPFVGNLAQTLLAPSLERHPDKTAYFCGEERVSYRELARSARQVAALLQVQGVRPDQRVLVVLLDSPVFVAALLGCALAGVSAVIVNTALSTEEYRFIVEDSGSRLVLASASLDAALALEGTGVQCVRCGESLAVWCRGLPEAPRLSVDRSADDEFVMLYTSGSTGRPKGVPHSGADVLATADAFAGGVLAMRPDDVVFSASKLFFAYGLGNSFSFVLRFGASAVLLPGKPDAVTIRRVVESRGVTLLFAVPWVYNSLLKTLDPAVRFTGPRLCVSAGEALTEPVLREWSAATGVPLLDGFGATETLHICISNRPDRIKAGTSGWPVPPYELRLAGPDGVPVEPGEPGALHVRGPSVARSYWRRPERTATTMLADGWLATGDVFREEEGCYCYLGRQDDLFKVNGEWVAPVRIEATLREHPAVLESGVTWRTLEGLVRPRALVVLNPGHAPAPTLEMELRRFAAARLPAHMVPVQIDFVAELPKTSTGKIQHFRLKNL